MITISVLSQKGGVGKTTLALHLACALAERGHRILLMDCDPQGSIAASLGMKPSEQPGWHQCAQAGHALAETRIKTRFPHLDILVAGPVPPEDYATWHSAAEHPERFTCVTDGARAEGYGVLLLDTPCGLQGPALGALRISDFALLPQQVHPLAAQSLPVFLELLVHARDQHHAHFQILGVVFTMFDLESPHAHGVASEVRQALPAELVANSYVPRDPALIEASRLGTVVQLLGRETPSLLAFNQLAVEMEGRLGLARYGSDHEKSIGLALTAGN